MKFIQTKDLDSVGHILLGFSAWSGLLYTIFFRIFVFRDKIGTLSKFWVLYLSFQCIKCPIKVETNQAYGATDEWPSNNLYGDLLLAQLIGISYAYIGCTVFTEGGKGSDNIEDKNTRYKRLLIIITVLSVIYLIIPIIILVLGEFTLSVSKLLQLINAVGAGYVFLLPSIIRIMYLFKKDRLTFRDKVSIDKAIIERFFYISLSSYIIGIFFGLISAFDGWTRVGKGPYGLFVTMNLTLYYQFIDKKFTDFDFNFRFSNNNTNSQAKSEAQMASNLY